MSNEPKLDAENLTPAQKAARTRAANKAKREAEAKLSVIEDVVPVIDNASDVINDAADSEFIQVTLSRVTPKIPSNARNVLYTIGIWLGVIATAGAPVVAVLSGDAEVLAASVVGLALSLSNLLAKMNLSKTADDIAKEAEKAVG